MEEKQYKTCPHCKNKIEVDNKVCPICFREIRDDIASETIKEKDLEFDNETNVNKHFCYNCGREISDDKAYCSNCGTPNKFYGVKTDNESGSRFSQYAATTINTVYSKEKADKVMLQIGLGLFLSIFSPFFGILLCVNGLRLSKVYYEGDTTRQVRAKILAIIGIVLSICFFVYTMYIYIVEGIPEI